MHSAWPVQLCPGWKKAHGVQGKPTCMPPPPPPLPPSAGWNAAAAASAAAGGEEATYACLNADAAEDVSMRLALGPEVVAARAAERGQTASRGVPASAWDMHRDQD